MRPSKGKVPLLSREEEREGHETAAVVLLQGEMRAKEEVMKGLVRKIAALEVANKETADKV